MIVFLCPDFCPIDVQNAEQLYVASKDDVLDQSISELSMLCVTDEMTVTHIKVGA